MLKDKLEEKLQYQDQDQQIEGELKYADKLAVGRTRMALERTLMAAIRTSVSMISFGFTIAKFFQDLKGLTTGKPAPSISSHNVGFWLVVIGTAYMIVSIIQHQLVAKNLHFIGEKKRISYSILLAMVIAILGLLLSISFYSDFLSLGLNQ